MQYYFGYIHMHKRAQAGEKKWNEKHHRQCQPCQQLTITFIRLLANIFQKTKLHLIFAKRTA